MGKFPGFEETSQNINPQSSPFNAQAQGVTNNIMASLGDASAKLGQVLATSQAEDALNKSKQAAAQAHQFAQLNGKADGSNFQQLFNDKYSELSQPIRDSLDPLAAEKFSSHEDKLKTEMSIQALQTSFEMKMKEANRVELENINSSASVIQANPSQAGPLLDSARQKFEKAMAEKSIPAQMANDHYDTAKKLYSQAYIYGMLEKGKTNISTLLNLKEKLGAYESKPAVDFTPQDMADMGLKAEDKKIRLGYTQQNKEPVDPKLSEVLRAITPEQRARALNHIDQLLKASTKQKVGGLIKELHQYSDKQLNGDTLNEAEIQRVMDIQKQLPAELKGQGAAIVQMLNVQQDVVATAIGKGRFAAQQMIDAINPQGSGPDTVGQSAAAIANYTERNKMMLKLQKTLDNVDNNRADSASMVQKYGEGVLQAKAAAADGDPASQKKWLDLQFSEQKRMGLEPSVLTHSEANSLATTFTQYAKAGTEDGINQFLKDINGQYGEATPLAIADVIRLTKDKVPPSIALVGILPNNQSRMSLMMNLRNKVEIDKNFEDASQADQNLKKDFHTELASASSKLVESFYGNDPKMQESPMAIGLRDAILMEAKKNLANRTANRGIFGGFSGMDASQAVKQAYKTVVEDNFHQIPAGSNYIMVPKIPTYNEKAIQAWVLHNSPISSGRYDFTGSNANRPGASAISIVPKVVGGDAPEWAQVNTNQADKPAAVFQRAARIMTTPDGLGVQLVVENQQGKYEAVLGKDGKPLMKSFKDMSLYIPDKINKYWPPAKGSQDYSKNSGSSAGSGFASKVKGIGLSPEATDAEDNKDHNQDYYDNLPAEE